MLITSVGKLSKQEKIQNFSLAKQHGREQLYKLAEELENQLLPKIREDCEKLAKQLAAENISV